MHLGRFLLVAAFTCGLAIPLPPQLPQKPEERRIDNRLKLATVAAVLTLTTGGAALYAAKQIDDQIKADRLRNASPGTVDNHRGLLSDEEIALWREAYVDMLMLGPVEERRFMECQSLMVSRPRSIRRKGRSRTSRAAPMEPGHG